jgi:hypothetical protein
MKMLELKDAYAQELRDIQGELVAVRERLDRLRLMPYVVRAVGVVDAAALLVEEMEAAA